jgi:hypothetical protein
LSLVPLRQPASKARKRAQLTVQTVDDPSPEILRQQAHFARSQD